MGFLCSFFRPGEMAVVTVIFLRHSREGRENSDHQIGNEKFSRELWIIHAQRSAFGTPDCVAQRAFRRVPLQQQPVRPWKLFGWNFNPRARAGFGNIPEIRESKFIVNFGGNSVLNQASFQRLGRGRVSEQCDRRSIHNQSLSFPISSCAAQIQRSFYPKLRRRDIGHGNRIARFQRSQIHARIRISHGAQRNSITPRDVGGAFGGA